MQFVRRHWYSIGLAFVVLAIMWAVLGDLNTVQVILLLNFVALLLHRFEEYAGLVASPGSSWNAQVLSRNLSVPDDKER